MSIRRRVAYCLDNMQERNKIRSVLELARYKVGDVAWWVVLRPIKPIQDLADEDQWMSQSHIHPKILYQVGPSSHLWPRKTALPKLQHMDFSSVVGLLTSKLVVRQFPICDLLRSRDTGEFFYSNSDNEWMPEGYLMDTQIAADRERSRILKHIAKWADDK